MKTLFTFGYPTPGKGYITQLMVRMNPPVAGVQVLGDVKSEHLQMFTPEAINFLAILHHTFEGERKQLLAQRVKRQAEIDRGQLPDFLPETAAIRADPSWRGPSLSLGLMDRKVEITGPVDRKMVINALNSDATQFMADFEGKLHGMMR